jgi:hypothetical protein
MSFGNSAPDGSEPAVLLAIAGFVNVDNSLAEIVRSGV